MIVGNKNEDIAYNFLTKAGWDEEKAAYLFNEENKKTVAFLTKYMKSKERKQKMKPKQINTYPEYKIDSINSIKYKIISYFKKDNTEYFNRYFSKIKNAKQTLDIFILELKKTSKTGIILLYSQNDMRAIRDQLKSIINEPLSKELFIDNTIIYPVIDDSPEGDNFINELECTTLPMIIICKYKNEESLAIIGKIGIICKLSDFRDKILESELVYYKNSENNKKIDNFDLKSSGNNHINSINEENKSQSRHEEHKMQGKNENNPGGYMADIGDYDFEDEEGLDFLYNFQDNNNIKMSDGQVLAFQEMKLKELEKVEEKKQIEERKILEEEQNYKDIVNKEIEESKKYAQNLRPEPDDSNPDKCIIVFRFPDGERTVQRKFLKQDKIQLLYDFIKSLGRDIFTEQDFHHFSILQTFPYKLFDDKLDNTLESEGLFPNSVLQIKEIE
jgi:hypothetical protein